MPNSANFSSLEPRSPKRGLHPIHPADCKVSLPDILAHNSAELTVDIHNGSASEKIVEVDASLPHHRQSQQLIFASQNGAWQVSAANLGR